MAHEDMTPEEVYKLEADIKAALLRGESYRSICSRLQAPMHKVRSMAKVHDIRPPRGRKATAAAEQIARVEERTGHKIEKILHAMHSKNMTLREAAEKLKVRPVDVKALCERLRLPMLRGEWTGKIGRPPITREIGGAVYTAPALAEKLGMSRTAALYRLKTWSDERLAASVEAAGE